MVLIVVTVKIGEAITNMKNKLVLFVLPALLVLSSCGTKPATDNKIFLEDTNAHEEIFGGFENSVDLRVKKEGEIGLTSITAPKIGYQINYDSVNDKLAIRFVAAIKETGVKAYWRRGFADPDGGFPQNKKFSDEPQQASAYYEELNGGNTVLKAGVGEYSDYVGFVVYTIRNIPYAANADKYVAAYVNLVGDEDSNIHNNSKGLAVRIEKKSDSESANVFTFDPTVTGHFLTGTINGIVFDGGENGLYRESGGTPSGNNAWYEKVAIKTTDSFGSFYYEQDAKFMFFGNSKYFDTAVDYIKESSLSGFNSAKTYDGYYTLYLSFENADHVYPTLVGYQAPIYFYAGGSDLWEKDNAIIKMEMWVEGVGNNYTEELDANSKVTIDGKSCFVSKHFDPRVYNGFRFLRVNPAGGTWNQTNAISYSYIKTNGPLNYYSIDGWDGNDNWHSYSL